MADRVSASITIGGSITADAYDRLAAIIADGGLSTEWDGAIFAPHDRTEGAPLQLYAHEVAWGRFESLEDYCADNDLRFARWSDGYPGEWGGERVVFTGAGKPVSYGASSGDLVTVDRDTVERLGSYAAILAYFAAAEFAVPPLRLIP